MNPTTRPTAGLALCASLFVATACAPEIESTPAPPEESMLVGSWHWRPDVSHIDVDQELQATQTSDFDNPGASPSRYAMTPTNDNLLVLEGWMANSACEIGDACDEGRIFQRHRQSYHVDAEHFFPFALLRISGRPGAVGGAGAGVFEAFGVTETHHHGPGQEATDVVEQRWRLELAADGTWESEDEGSESSGTWTYDASELVLHDEGGEIRRTRWKGDVIALDGLVFDRAEP